MRPAMGKPDVRADPIWRVQPIVVRHNRRSAERLRRPAISFRRVSMPREFSPLVGVRPLGWTERDDELTGHGFSERRPMARHRSHSVEFKRQIAQEFLSGETLHDLAKRHDVSRNFIRIWVSEVRARRIPRRCAGGQSHLGIRGPDRRPRTAGWQAGSGTGVSKGALKSAPRPKNGTSSVITGPAASPSRKDAG